MSAVLTLGTIAVAANGKTVTATIAGGTGTGYAVTSLNGLHIDLQGGTGGPWTFPNATVAISGTTLTLTLALPVGSGETVKLNTAVSSDLTDSGANTISVQSNVAVTNNSTTVVTSVTSTDAGLEFGGVYSGNQLRGPGAVDFVADATDVGILCYAGNTTSITVDDAASATTINSANQGGDGFWVIRALGTGLAASKHLFRGDWGDYFTGLRLSGSGHAMSSVAHTRVPMITWAGSSTLAATSPVKLWSAYFPIFGQVYGAQTGTYTDLEMNFAFTGSGVDSSAVANSSGQVATLMLDGAAVPNMTPMTDTLGTNNAVDHVTLLKGLTRTAHQAALKVVGLGVNTWFNYLRVLTGSVTTASAAIGDTLVTVADVTNIAVGAWVWIDQLNSREVRKVASITGTGPYTVNLSGAALRKVHPAGVVVEAYNSPLGSFTTYTRRDLSGHRAVTVGDSNVQAWNDNGQTGTADSNGIFYNLYDPRHSPFYLATEAIGWEHVNLGIAGQTTAQMAARANDIFGYSRSAYDVVMMFPGTNDINGASSATPTQWKASVKTMIDAAIPYLRTGGKIIVIPTPTPAGVTNAGGLNYAAQLVKIAELVSAYPGVVFDGTLAVSRIVAGDIAGVHYHDSGHTKIAQDVIPLMVSNAIFTNTGGYAFPVGQFTKI